VDGKLPSLPERKMKGPKGKMTGGREFCLFGKERGEGRETAADEKGEKEASKESERRKGEATLAEKKKKRRRIE